MEYLKRYNVITIFGILICLCTMFFYPVIIAKSAFEGARMWAVSIFPTLFPFFVCTNMLIDLGFAKFMGELLSPFMIPVFGVSGIGSFPLFSGMMSGYPVGAKITCNLYTDDKLNKNEAQRLLGIANKCGPLFIIGVIGGYIFKNIAVGYYILFVHILSAYIYGVFLNIFFGRINSPKINSRHFVREAFYKMRTHTSDNKKTFGQILSDAVEGAVKSSLVVLGFVVLFSVISTIIEIFHLHELLTYLINNFTHINFDGKTIESAFMGAIEMTAGLFLLDSTINRANIMIAVFIVTFGGLSVHAQSISFISKTDLSGGIYIFDKLLESLVSILIVFLTYPFLRIIVAQSQSTKAVFLNNSYNFSNFVDIRNNYMIICLAIILFISFFGLMSKNKKS